MYRLLTIALILFISSSASADIRTADYNKCKSVTDTLKRLVCYDALGEKDTGVTVTSSINSEARVVAAPKVVEQQNTVSRIATVDENSTDGWQTKVDRNPKDFTKNKVTASLLATSSYPEYLNPQLFIHCDSRKTSFYINWGKQLERADSYDIKIDGKDFVSSRWNLSKNKQLTYFPKPPLSMMKQMFEADNYSVQINFKDGSNMKANFDIRGMVSAVEDIRYSCEW